MDNIDIGGTGAGGLGDAKARWRDMKKRLIDEFTYASEENPLRLILAIRGIELLTGQPYLKRMYHVYQSEKRPHGDAFRRYLELIDVEIALHGTPLEEIPRNGPVIFVANHPYGVLDGIIMCALAARVRPDFKVVITKILCRFPELAPHILPLDFTENPRALDVNIDTRKRTRDELAGGGAVVLFPSGAISVKPRLFDKRAVDLEWKPFLGQLVRRYRPHIVPVCFAGQNSSVFHFADRIHQDLKRALIFYETRRHVGKQVDVVIGKPLSADDVADIPTADLVAHLQAHTMAQSALLPPDHPFYGL